MSLLTSILLAALASTIQVQAHGTVSGIVADGTYFGGYKLDYYYMAQNGQTPPETVGWSAENLDNGFIDGTGYQSEDVICHKNSAPGKISAPVKAGGEVDFQWTTWPDSHVGPVITYMANCNGDCTTVPPASLKFVKIDAVGLTDGTWAASTLIANNNTWTTTIPSSIAAGNYVLRHEIIALHSAGQQNGAQNYMQCINVEVTGSGTDALSAGTLATELYTNQDKGILFNVYQGATAYEIPGPALYEGAGSGGQGNTDPPAASAPVATPAPSSTVVGSSPTLAPVRPSPTNANEAPEATSVLNALADIVAVLPSELLTGALPTAVPTPIGGNSSLPVPTQPLPEGLTLQDLLDWVQYSLGNYFANKSGRAENKGVRRHARDIEA